jgi:predicted SAM-dependent methyltransferase
MGSVRINIGCGMTPTPGWTNYDNSISVRLSRYPMAERLLKSVGLLNAKQSDFTRFCRTHDIRWAHAVRRIPEPSNSVDVLYSSHMFEHLDRREARTFLVEAMRVLRPGATLRLVLPDLRLRVNAYLSSGDGDRFVASLDVCQGRPRNLKERLQATMLGFRGHRWMYDTESLAKFLSEAGFVEVSPCKPGETTIDDPGALDLRERERDSIYIEARKPSGAPAAGKTAPRKAAELIDA